MPANPNHHVCIHGHFYQPPRENPWLGVIEEQPSAAPYHDWNTRIATECYTALTRSPIRDEKNEILDLFNCFAHLSFNIGPTLFSWMEYHTPETLRRIRLGNDLAIATYQGHGGAIAQPYNHPILPLCDARDRHTQIVWGLREFRHRFGRESEGMWLPECAIDRNTVRALIDHGVRFVILSPKQASKVRRFGSEEWIDVFTQGIETRHPYRVFEVDGGGRTHFDRYLDVFFYDPGLSLKISFEHLLRDIDRFEWYVRERLDADAALPQLVLIATDGEVYGHHERHGEETLAQFYARVFRHREIYLSTLGQYLAENPPCWEVKLWEGEDGRGSSWSCEHGIGRWMRDCGCQTGGRPEWNQRWRGPLRAAFDRLRVHIREILRREGSRLFRDYSDARDDYIHILLDPSETAREAFLQQHARLPLTSENRLRAWKLLEADRHAMMMYTSCGWFFAELSGLEPVQNMRYALRAAELLQEYSHTDLTHLLLEGLQAARSNLPELGTGADIFRRSVLPTRYSARVIAAVYTLARLLNLPPPPYRWDVDLREEGRATKAGFRTLWGVILLRDPRTTETSVFSFFAAALEEHLFGVLVAPPDDPTFLKRLKKSSPEEIEALLATEGITAKDLPEEERRRFLRVLFEERFLQLERETEAMYDRMKPFYQLLFKSGFEIPATLRVIAERALRNRFFKAFCEVVEQGGVESKAAKTTQEMVEEGKELGISIDRSDAAQFLSQKVLSNLTACVDSPSVAPIDQTLRILQFGEEVGVTIEEVYEIRDRYWCLLHHEGKIRGEPRPYADRLVELGIILGFDPAMLRHKTEVLLRRNDGT